jgi:hypothetical protein
MILGFRHKWNNIIKMGVKEIGNEPVMNNWDAQKMENLLTC